ncbi:hypothetical protein GCM10022380_80180 [Amycolatopsis tucumanensis]|uniref:Uncharacterized protein n=1 Tax=Amycolatopsis tucumanensis TaxID=401106 RepID=A0ABP7JP15_9PSEU
MRNHYEPRQKSLPDTTQVPARCRGTGLQQQPHHSAISLPKQRPDDKRAKPRHSTRSRATPQPRHPTTAQPPPNHAAAPAAAPVRNLTAPPRHNPRQAAPQHP